KTARPVPQLSAPVVDAQLPHDRRRIPPVSPDADAIAKHQPLGGPASHDRANARRADLVGKLRLRAWLKAHVAERHPKQPRADSMPSFVNASAPTQVVVHDADLSLD